MFTVSQWRAHMRLPNIMQELLLAVDISVSTATNNEGGRPTRKQDLKITRKMGRFMTLHCWHPFTRQHLASMVMWFSTYGRQSLTVSRTGGEMRNRHPTNPAMVLKF